MAEEGLASAQSAGKSGGEDGLADFGGTGENDHAHCGDEVGDEPVGLGGVGVVGRVSGTLKENGSHTLWGL